MFSNLNALIDNLSLDHRRGAAEIVEDTHELLADIAAVGAKEPETALTLFRRCIKRLGRGQPSMAPVLNLLNRACRLKDKLEDDWLKLEFALTQLRTHSRDHLTEMLFRVDDLLKVESTLITFSNSSTVAQLIVASHEIGRIKRVLCSEGRPIMEGLTLARKLTAEGVPVTMLTDAALMSRVVECDAVWVGGDSLSHEGLVNKVGSLALSMLCKALDIPFVSLMSSDKLLSPDLFTFFRLLPQNPREIADDDADLLDVQNEYYESIPLELVNYVFTEKGLSKPANVLRMIGNEPISPLFRELVQDGE
ncbi:hypothetical protein K9N50_02685 [bacterium]|nr:hypothetical protein [bacterium]